MSKPNNTYENLIKENTMSEFEKMISFYREYPDYFLDSMKTESTMYELTPFQRVYLRSFFRFKKVGIVASRGISKCVTGNTLISTSNGLVKIGDLANWSKEEKDEFAGNYVMNINGDIEFSDMIISNGLKDTKKIRTVFGYEIEGTHVHPILVMNKRGEMEFKTLSELSRGDYVAINRKGVFGTNTKLEFDMDTYIDTRNKNQYKVKHVEVPNVVDEYLAYYLGLLQGNGCLTLKTGVIFTSIDKELIDFFQNYNREVFGLETFRRNEDRHDYMMYSVYVREYLRQIGIGFEESNEKVIPNSIMSAPKNIVSKFLRGLFDTDGTVNENYASVTTSSEEMSIQIQQLLLNFGITSKRSKRFNKKFETYSYQIYFASNNIDIFSKEINFGLKRKRDILESHKNKIRNTNVNIIPYQSEKIKKILENNTHLLPKEKKDFAHVISGENQLTYYRLKKLLFLDIKKDTRYADMLGMYEDNFFWDKVDTIEDGKDYVYDFHVPISHTFVGNGFVNHNTYLNVLAHYIKCILYPNNHLCLAMPTKEQSAKVVKEKVEEYWRDYPMLKNELILSKCKFDKDYVKLVFKNGSTLDTLTVGQSSRGLRANGLSLEEIVDERMDRTTINEVLLPILAQPRMIPRFGADLDNEYSKTQAYVTTASNKQSYCYEKFSNLFEEMEQGKATIVLGTSYEMGTRFGTLSEEDIVEKMEDATYSPLSFDKNLSSKLEIS